MKFSANLGFLWAELPLPRAIFAAQDAGFDAVECHWPYDTPASEVNDALKACGFTMLGLNTLRGNPGENGLAALPGREKQARIYIDKAIAYAQETGTLNVHVMAGISHGARARETFIANLTYASDQALAHGITILIEPLNNYDAPGYFLTSCDQAVSIMEEVARPNLKLMFDCYHVQLMEGDLCHRLQTLKPHIGHIQFASVPDRGPPDWGEIDYSFLFSRISELGYDLILGAEYKPSGPTENSLDWMKTLCQLENSDNVLR